MNLSQLIALLLDSTKADSQYGIMVTWINTALHELGRRRSWRGMKATINLTIPGGNGSVNLPTNFKEPQSGKNPLRGMDNTTPQNFVNWFLYSKQEIMRLLEIQVGAPDRKAYIDFDGTNWNLNTLGQVGSTTMFSFDIYQYLADLANPTDANYMTREYPLLVLEQAKVYAFRHLNTEAGYEAAQVCQGEVERQFQIASADDGYREVRGRVFRMGGY